MTPTFFGEGGRLFGWVHEPTGAPRSVGVVLCGGHGDELMCSVPTLRLLAMRLAAAGFWVLRFDYDGHGDSLGSDRDPDRLPAWRRSVHEACDFLRATASVEQVHLFGMRLGALLATIEAAQRQDVASLVLWSPVTKARMYLRELKAFHATSAGTEWAEKEVPSVRGPEDAEVGGFFWSKQTLEQLGKLDALAVDKAPTRALLIGRDELPLDDKLIAHLRQLGCNVEPRQALGYAGMMTSRHNSKRAVDVIEAVVGWLSDATPPGAGAAPAPVGGRAASAPEFVEEPIQFGPGQRLFGLVTRPVRATTRPAILLMSIGANHHIGSNGLYVRFARAFAALGFSSLRFDLSGIGDSEAAPGERDNQPYPKGALDDVRAAMEVLRARGHRRFVMIGLCSGGYHAFKTAVRDPSVVGLMVINPQTFDYQEGAPLDVTRRHWSNVGEAKQYQQSMLSLEKWKKLLRGQVNVRHVAGVVLERAKTVIGTRLRRALGLERDAKRLAFGDEFAKLCERGTDFFMIFSTDDPGLDYLKLHAARQVEALRGHPRFGYVEIAGPDHTFTPLWSQAELQALLVERLQRFGESS